MLAKRADRAAIGVSGCYAILFANGDCVHMMCRGEAVLLPHQGNNNNNHRAASRVTDRLATPSGSTTPANNINPPPRLDLQISELEFTLWRCSITVSSPVSGGPAAEVVVCRVPRISLSVARTSSVQEAMVRRWAVGRC